MNGPQILSSPVGVNLEKDPNFELMKYRQEWWKTAVSALTPIMIAVLTFFITGALNVRESGLRRGEQLSSDKQKIYSQIAPDLNIVYVFVSDIGDFRSYSPDTVIDKKRSIDRIFFSYRPYWSEETITKYNRFMDASFEFYSDYASNARIRTSKDQKKAAFDHDGKPWDPKWDSMFTGQTVEGIDQDYYDLITSLLSDAADPQLHTSNSQSHPALTHATDQGGSMEATGTPAVACWKLPNGKVLLPGDPLLTSGWGSSSWVGNPPGPDIERYEAEAERALGFKAGFWASGGCSSFRRCTVSAESIRDHSTAISIPSDCK
jgi:hypothetical protein